MKSSKIKMQQRLFTFLIWLSVILIPLPLIIILNRGLIDTPAHLMAYDFGVFAYVWWLMIIILSTRPRWLTQKVGMPTLYAIHGSVGILALIAATIHRLNSFSMFPLIKETGNIAWYLEIFSMLLAVIFLSGWLTDRFQKIADIKRFMERHLFKHQVTIWLHRLNFLAVGLIWLHVWLIPRLRNVSGFTMLFNGYTLIAICIYCWWKLKIKRQSQGIVKENTAIGQNIQRIVITLPKRVEYHAGDFYFLSFQKQNNRFSEPHPFSVGSAPSEHPNEAIFMIRRLGDFTRQLDQFIPGTRVRMEGPFGLFDQEITEANGPIVLYGMGAGMVPLLGLAQQYANKKKIHLLWTGRLAKEDEYQKILRSLADKGVQIELKDHRFSKDELKSIFDPNEVQTARLIIVGPSSAVLSTRRILKKIGFKNNQLIDERMTL